MTVVAADGLPVRPVTIDEFRIAVAETFDVIVEPTGQEAFTIFAQAMDRTGYAAGTLATRAGLAAPVPEADPRPVLTMTDMGHGRAGHDMGSMGANASPAPAADPHAGHAMPAPEATPADPHAGHAPDPRRRILTRGHDMSATAGAMQAHPPTEQGNPLVDMQTMTPVGEARRPGHRPAGQRPTRADLRRPHQCLRRSRWS